MHIGNSSSDSGRTKEINKNADDASHVKVSSANDESSNKDMDVMRMMLQMLLQRNVQDKELWMKLLLADEEEKKRWINLLVNVQDKARLMDLMKKAK